MRPAAIALAALLLVPVTSACHTAVPLADASAARDAEVTLEVGELARVELRSVLGDAPRRVAGRLVAVSDTSYTLAVREVESLGGTITRWDAERVTVPRRLVTNAWARRPSRRRTALVAATTAGAVALFLATRSLVARGFGGGDAPRGGGPGDPAAGT